MFFKEYLLFKDGWHEDAEKETELHSSRQQPVPHGSTSSCLRWWSCANASSSSRSWNVSIETNSWNSTAASSRQ
jgi:hypothetical protein